MDEEDKAVEDLLDFLYTLHYPFKSSKLNVRYVALEIELDMRMYTLGDEHLIPELKEKAGVSFRHKLNYLCQNDLSWNTGVEQEIENVICITHEDLPDTE